MSPLFSSCLIFSQVMSTLISTVGLEDGMRLRLVNRAFNEEVLRLYFVVGLKRNSFKGLRNRAWAKYCLQGHLSTGRVRTILDKPALDSFHQAIDLLREMPSWPRLQNSLSASPLVGFGEIDISSHWIYERASAAVCEAAVYHDSPVIVLTLLNSPYCPNDPIQRQYFFSTMDARFWSFLAACTIGDVPLVHDAIHALQKMSNLTQVEFINYLSQCLCVPALLGHKHVVQQLLDLGADANFLGSEGISKDTTALALAAMKGKRDVVELLLQPRYHLRRTGWEYEEALSYAASFPELQTRRELVQLLLTHGHDFNQPSLRNRLFDAACEVNDTTLAESILVDGPVQMSDAFSDQGWGETALSSAARNGHLESVRLILQSDFAPAATDVVYNAHWMALRAAVGANSITIFREILPYTKQSRSHEALIMAAAVDGGFSAMGDLLPRVDLSRRFQGSTVGESGLYQALVHLRPENVEFLLEHGVCARRRVQVLRCDYRRNPHAFEVIQDLLRHYNLPQLEVR